MPAMKVEALRRYLQTLRSLIKDELIVSDKAGNFARYNRAEAQIEIIDLCIALITDNGGEPSDG